MDSSQANHDQSISNSDAGSARQDNGAAANGGLASGHQGLVNNPSSAIKSKSGTPERHLQLAEDHSRTRHKLAKLARALEAKLWHLQTIVQLLAIIE